MEANSACSLGISLLAFLAVSLVLYLGSMFGPHAAERPCAHDDCLRG